MRPHSSARRADTDGASERVSERISVVLPVYNEHDNIAVCLRGLWEALSSCEHEILVCYDFDEDSTLSAIAAMPDAPPSVRLVKNTLGRGAPNAIRAGFQAAKGDVVVTTMADLSDPPEVILAMAEKIRAGADVVAGSRYARGGSQSGGPRLKRALSECAGRSLAWIAGLGTSDATSNFRGYSRRFLDRVTVESRAGFEIALELTVKAHLSGHRVDEVPSSWVDRTAGQSRFRLWKWLPNYLGWYLKAAVAPIAVWIMWTALALVLRHGLSARGFAIPSDALAAALFAAPAAFAILAARSLRGRTIVADLVLVLVWLHPWQASVASSSAAPYAFAGAALASGAWWFATCPRPALRARGVRAWTAVRDHVNTHALGWAVVTLLLWSAHVAMPRRASGAELDTSWAQALGYALREGFRFGREIVFTYGPLGYFNTAPYDAQLYWTKVVAWEIALKLALIAFVVRAIARLPSALERVACVLALLLLNPEQDHFFYLAILAAAAPLLEHGGTVATANLEHAERRSGGARTRDALAIAALAIVAIAKFTYFLLAAIAIAAACAVRWRERSARAALGLAAGSVLVLVVAWCACAQSPLDLPAYVVNSLAIAGAYNEAMSAQGPWIEVRIAYAALLAYAAAVGIAAWLERRSLARLLLSLVWIAGAYLAFKAGFVRHMRNSVTFFAFAAVAPYLLPPARADGARAWIAQGLEKAARFACLAACATGYVIALHYERIPLERLGQELTVSLQRELSGLADPHAFQAMREDELAPIRKSTAMPRVRARVGRESIDVLGSSQGIAFTNGLAWTPRPVFQSYVAYTEELLEKNARFFESERAPSFVLFRPESIDQRWPMQEDSRAIEVLLRRYAPVMSEGGYLLFEKRSAPRLAPGARPMLLERTIAFGERVDLSKLSARALALAVDVRYTALGRAWKVLGKSPPVTMQSELSNGTAEGYRIVPGMMRSGVLVDPYLDTEDRWIRWMLGEESTRLLAFEIRTMAGKEWMFDPEIRVRAIDMSDLAPDPDDARRAGLEYSMFATAPKAITTPVPPYRTTFLNDEVLVVYAPSELRFDVSPGEHRLTATFGIHPDAFLAGSTDGLAFQAVLVASDKTERVIFERKLDPMRVRPDRRRLSMDVSFHVDAASELVLRADPGPAGDGTNDLAFWSGIEIQAR